ncbi:MAG TPA: EAL domain-containing protein [Caldimonas sp.]|jgi:diguanylate cyclase (GGDEF)-like protein|nr:EAL domain-containing protein [Caldimonas sp.]HEX2541875.1 EAL domain-containing protein [Caldimonas sp.]
MTLLDSQRLLPGVAALAISTALLWLGAEVFASARQRSRILSLRLKACAIFLIGCGLWWPPHFLASIDVSGGFGSMPALAIALALTLAGLSTASAVAATRKTVPAFAGFATLTLLVAYGHSVVATPGLFRLTMAAGSWGPGLAIFLLASLLVGIALEFKPSRKAFTARGAAAFMGAGLISLAASVPSGMPGQVVVAPWAEALLLVALLAITKVMLESVTQGAALEQEPAMRRTNSATPTVDSLTQLPTRVYFEDRLAAAATKADASGSRLALLFIDLDGFKPVNDTYGHSIGDLVLEQVGQRLKALSRGKDVVARVGGDEFLLLLTNVASQEGVVNVSDRLIKGLSQPYTAEGREVMISCSVGIAMYPDGCSHAKLIARADAAMYASKRSGGSTHCFYSTAMDADAEAQFELLRDLRKAIAQKEFELFYQPKIDSKSGKVTAVEALLRWKHPTRGVLLPSTFIPIAERFGLIGPIGNWVIEDACRQSRQWRDKGLRMRVAINLSAHQMRQDDIVERITGALHTHRIHPSLLTCEITESTAMEDTKTTQATFRRLGELGTHLSIDDFGTGYSSLSYLRRLPAEELKIDRSFIMDLEHSADARAVVDAVIKLAHALGLKVVAEGVENPRQQQVLAQMQCDELQGFLFAKPMSARALLLWAINDRDDAAVFKPSLFDETRQSERA